MQLIKKFFPVVFPMLRRRITYTLILTGALLSPHLSPLMAKVVEQVVVVIDGEPYTLTSFKEYARTKMGRDFPTGDLNRIEKDDQEVLEQFITEKLLAAEVQLAGVMISEEDIDRYIDRIKERNRLRDEELVEALKREGTTMENYRASIRAEIEKNEIINRQVRKRVNITSEDVERYYRLNPKQFTTQERVRLRHICFPCLRERHPSAKKRLCKGCLASVAGSPPAATSPGWPGSTPRVRVPRKEEISAGSAVIACSSRLKRLRLTSYLWGR